jgi:thioredoxin-related protein
MKKTFLFFFLIISVAAFSQNMKTFNLYKPGEKAEKEIENAVAEAGRSGKNVLIQVGGNWCIWCARFHEYITKDAQLDSLVNANYVVYHLNYSKENHNEKLLTKYKFPQRFGFPVFLVLDKKGELIHTQNSWYLEDGAKSYDREKVKTFLTDWGPKAFDPARYKEQ